MKEIFIVSIIFVMGIKGLVVSNSIEPQLKNDFILEGYRSGDAKIANEYIVANKGTIKLINSITGEIKDLGIKSNWLDCLIEKDKIIIIYSNRKNEVGSCVLDRNGELIETRIISTNDSLHIDPSILKVDESYYITLTEIQGNINNADPTKENGKYTVKLFKSEDLVEWEYVSDIVTHKNNVEDVELNYYNNELGLTYEKETVDKGVSSICMVTSTDKGVTWNKEKELISATADHEPAALLKEKDRYVLYYSSDKENKGSSYSGSKPYYTILDKNFNALVKDEAIPTKTDKGILLYDVFKEGNHMYMLYAIDYLEDNSLMLEIIK